jgi:hypothetical protein
MTSYARGMGEEQEGIRNCSGAMPYMEGKEGTQTGKVAGDGDNITHHKLATDS